MAVEYKQDNSTGPQKLSIRRLALTLTTEPPVILETHGGMGRVYRELYTGIERGVVFDKDPQKAAFLAAQRPTWAVYEADCEKALAAGAGAHLPINLLDLDPYGSPWPALTAFLDSDRPRPARLVVVAQDGLRQKVRLGGSWDVETLRPFVEKYGNDLHPIYLEVCRELLESKAAGARYRLDRFTGYYCGANQSLTHWLGILERS